jgi:RIO kinase 1
LNYDDWDDEDESFSKRKDRRRPKGRRSVKDLKVDAASATSSAHRFEDDGLQRLFERGLLTDVEQQLKSGKEATVYLATGPTGPLVAKVYRDEAHRALKDDTVYRQGRFVSDKRVKKMLDQSGRRGLSSELALWVYHEYTMLWRLHEAGVPVPKPAVGPGGEEIAQAGRVVLMERIMDGDEPAPRLADIDLTPEEAASAWEQSVALLGRLQQLGWVHGDLSAYNLLWRDGEVVLIDLPQMVEIGRNRHARMLFQRDVESLVGSFRRLGIEADPLEVVQRTQRSG